VIVEGRALTGEAPHRDAADVVVVGSGAGGAVVAAHLAEAGFSVIVVEEGPHVPQSVYGQMRPSESLRHLWRDAGLTMALGLGDTPVINVMMGECVGGSSVLTGGVCFRTPGAVLTEWADALGLEGLGEAAMEPYFDDVERAVHVETVPLESRSRSTTMFARGAERLGHPVRPLRRNTKGCTGCGRCNFGCPEGAKMSVDMTYLPRAVAAGARVYSDFHVERVDVKGARATGVSGTIRRVELGERRRFVIEGRLVVLAAGAYCTPLLLARAGIGKQSGQVGRNLTLHPGFRVMARFEERIEGWKGALQGAYCHDYERERVNMVGMFVPPGVLAATMPGVGDAQGRAAADIPNLAVFGGMVHDDAGGRVHHLFGQRVVTYRMSKRDRAAASRVLSLLGQTFFAGGAREVYLPILGERPFDADRFRALDLAAVPGRKLECTSQHPLGTARMGVSAEHAVVSPSGETWELQGLFVADGSVMPTSLGVNPQETVMAMATRIAWGIRDRSSSRALL
jgi:choline dehydrogenase-like flavoprotein